MSTTPKRKKAVRKKARKKAAKPAESLPTYPAWLDPMAAEIWLKVAPTLSRGGILPPELEDQLAVYCIAMADCRRARMVEARAVSGASAAAARSAFGAAARLALQYSGALGLQPGRATSRPPSGVDQPPADQELDQAERGLQELREAVGMSVN